MEFIQAAHNRMKLAISEPGNISYRILPDICEHGTYIFYEEWQEKFFLDEHMSSNNFMEFTYLLQEVLTEMPNITTYESTLI